MNVYRSYSPYRVTVDRDQSKAVDATKDQIAKHLAIVIKLHDHNAPYLEEFEKAWIDHIINNAFATVGAQVVPDEFVVERPSRSRGWLHESLLSKQVRTNNRGLTSSEEELKSILTIAKSLNAAINLLSCCYDRWNWLRSAKCPDSRALGASDELAEFLNWKRRNAQPREPSVVPDSSMNRFSSQHPCSPTCDAISHGNPANPRADSFDTTCHKSTSSDEDSDMKLLFFVVDTVEKWRQNAEDALDATTKRYQGGRILSIRRHPLSLRKGDLAEESAVSTATQARMFTPHSLSLAHKPEPEPKPPVSQRNTTHHSDTLNELVNRTFNSTIGGKDALGGPHEAVLGSLPLQSARYPVPNHQPNVISPSSSTWISNASLTPYVENGLKNSFDKEPSSGQTQTHSPHMSSESVLKENVPGKPSMSSLSSSSSVIFSQSTNQSKLSFHSKSPDDGPVRRSRGRAWLERQAEHYD